MQILLYEFVTGGGLWGQGEAPQASSLRDEGAAMLAALADDLSGCTGVEVIVFRDARLPEFTFPAARVVEIASCRQETESLRRWAQSSDATWLVAPESGGLLLDRCRTAELVGARLISPDSRFVELATDKALAAGRLAKRHVPVPQSQSLSGGETLPRDFPYPAVLKPRDGAGSEGVRVLRNSAQTPPQGGAKWRLERFHPGLAASVAVVAGPSDTIFLPPCRQQLSGDGSFKYLGGAVPLEASLSDRARHLAERTVRALPATTGYFGIDLILGAPLDGSQDVVIEINPRLTTSYLGLRRLARSNLAAATLAVIEGRQYDLTFASDLIEFAPG